MPIMTEEDVRYNLLIKTFASEPEPGFESESEQEFGWGQSWGCRNDVGRLRAVLMHRPGHELHTVDPAKKIEELGAYGDPELGWYWRGSTPPDLPAMQTQHDSLVKVLEENQVKVVMLDDCALGRMKSCYTRDVVVAVDGGAIVCRLGPRVRRGEEQPATRTLAKLGMPILRTIHGTGIMEGGSFAWLNEDTAVIGISSRVNNEAADQFEEVLNRQGVELLRMQVPGFRLHIDGMLVMVDVDTALINPILLPFEFMEELKSRGIRLIELSPEDAPFTINCLAIAPGRVVMSEASERTLEKLDKAGIETISIDYEAVWRGGGGIHCSTAPLARDRL
ncbi:MAG: amidinotransferase [Rhodospirillaceae bacterium]|nr:amidinotransferase [Rhodospirillaceae bacterium]|tara:strand:- start:3608 stop:4612 length:1005 start_codon:yes stop_codon:yes gene_type:complete